MKIYKELQQGTDEWLKARLLHLTASEAQAIASNGKGLETLVTKIMADYYTGGMADKFKSYSMQNGNDLENLAKEAYEFEKGVNVETVGFIEVDEYTGASPDGIVEDDGLVEIKCCNYIKHYEMLRDRKPDSKYIWQCQMQMLVAERKWCDLVYYNPDFETDKALIIFRIEPDQEKFEKLQLGIEKGKKLIKEQLIN